VTPGGGLDDGESFEDAAARELREKVGRDDLPIGPCVWLRNVIFTWAGSRSCDGSPRPSIRSGWPTISSACSPPSHRQSRCTSVTLSRIDVVGGRYGRAMRRERLGGWTLLFPETRRERARGLLDLDRIDPFTALVLLHCRSVHTFGMRFPIDVVLLNGRMLPLGRRRLAPGRLMLPRPSVRHVVEVAAGQGDALARGLAGGALLSFPRVSNRRRALRPHRLVA
jgi:hypothetical protein